MPDYQALNQPQGISVLLDNGTRLLLAGVRPVLIVLLLMLIVDTVLYNIFGAELVKNLENFKLGQMPNIRFEDVLAFMLPLTLANTFFNNVMIAIYSRVAEAETPTLLSSVKIGLQKLPAVIVYLVLYMLAFAALPTLVLFTLAKVSIYLALFLFILTLIPATLLSITLYFGNYLIVADDAGIIESLSRSHKLVRPHLARTGLYLTFTSIIQIISSLLMPVVVALLIPFLNDLKLRETVGKFTA